MSTQTKPIETVVDPFAYQDEQDDGNEHRTHIINPPMNLHIWRPGMVTLDVVDIARFNGLEIFALCGYRFVPKRNPDKYPLCENCLQEAKKIMRECGE